MQTLERESRQSPRVAGYVRRLHQPVDEHWIAAVLDVGAASPLARAVVLVGQADGGRDHGSAAGVERTGAIEVLGVDEEAQDVAVAAEAGSERGAEVAQVGADAQQQVRGAEGARAEPEAVAGDDP